MAARHKAYISWSSGKDSAYALYIARQQGEVEIVGMLTTLSEKFARVSMHGVREELLDAQAAAAGLPVIKVGIPSPCPNEVYEAKMAAAMDGAKAQGVTHMVFGDLFLEDIREYRLAKLSPIGVECVFPLWLRDTAELADEMMASGLRATITTVDPKQLDRSFAGRAFDAGLLRDLPESVDPCGENGEFHTVATHGPMFSTGIDTVTGEVVERDGFIFADVLPA